MANNWFYDRLGNPKFPDLTNPWFVMALLLKIAAACVFGSAYLRELFAPFVDYFLATGQDPYAHFNQAGVGNAFPYPPVMLAILSVGRSLTTLFAAADPAIFGVADALGLRLPLLVADFAIYLVLSRWFRNKQKQVLYFYWLSPLAFYISYMHGQLDAVPMAFLFVSLHFLFRQKLLLSVLFFVLAFGCKTHMALVLPFYLWYLWKNADRNITELMKPAALLVLGMAAVHLPFYSQDYVQMVFQNKVQGQVFDLFYQFNAELKFLFIPAVLLLLVGWYFSLRFVNKDQLLLFLGFTFIALTLMIAPMQGWYYWILPFMVFFILRHGSQMEARVFVAVNIAYAAYFLLTPGSDYFRLIQGYGPIFFDALKEAGWPADKLLNIAFTLMQTSLLVFAYLVYRNGIRQNIQSKFLSQPYLLGIGGDSASGKSTLSTAIQKLFGNRYADVVRGDDMHKWERGDENWQSLTHLNPKANHLHENLRHSVHLKRGRKVSRSHYDHQTGKFTLPQFIQPKKLVIFEGLHSFYLQNQADVYDLKIFMAPEEELRTFWKLQRDVKKRGYDAGKVAAQLESRREDSKKFIQTQASLADILFEFYATDKAQLAEAGSETMDIGLKVCVKNELYVDPLVEELQRYNELKTRLEYEGPHIIMYFEGKMPQEYIERIAENVLPELEEVGVYAPVWEDDYSGIMQLLTAYIMFRKLAENGL